MANCEICGQPMPAGEEMFKFHGYSGPCPSKPMKMHIDNEALKSQILSDIADGIDEYGAGPDDLGGLLRAMKASSGQTDLKSLAVQPAKGLDAHPDDIAVDRFAAAMKAKLSKKREEGVSGWDDPEKCHIDYLAHRLREQLHSRAVLDPVDIGNFAMMLHNRSEKPSHGR